jgi:NDP-sugar pyrophosphorylase family protein
VSSNWRESWIPEISKLQAFPQNMPTTAILLAGGLGTRLRAVIADQPKVLAPVAGRPFLDYLLAHLAEQGITHVILSTGYMGEQVRAFAQEGKRWGLQIDYAQESKPLGTGGALSDASASIEAPFFALNGDTLFMVNLNALWLAHQDLNVWGTIALRSIPANTPGWQSRGCVRLVGQDHTSTIQMDSGLIQTFAEKPTSAPAATLGDKVLVNGGVYVLEKSALADISPGQQVSIERQVFPKLIAQDMLAGQIQQGYFADIGTPESLAVFGQDVKKGKI